MTIPNESDAKLPYAAVLSALGFAAKKHRDRRRKDSEASPYINHPIAVAEVLAGVGGVTDLVVLQAAVLHATIEDTATTEAELAEHSGVAVARLVAEVTDDKKLPQAIRKRLQIEHAPKLSPEAKLIKLGDRICNVRDVTHTPPGDWSAERRLEYLDWSRQVVAGCRGVNAALESYYSEHKIVCIFTSARVCCEHDNPRCSFVASYHSTRPSAEGGQGRFQRSQTG